MVLVRKYTDKNVYKFFQKKTSKLIILMRQN